eukprot:4968918-Amphidinium_carterae.1
MEYCLGICPARSDNEIPCHARLRIACAEMYKECRVPARCPCLVALLLLAGACMSVLSSIHLLSSVLD